MPALPDAPAHEPTARTAVEQQVARLVAAGDIDGATELVLRSFGGELLGFLHGVTSRPQDAEDAFSVLAAAVWRSLPAFAWRSSLRTWLYVLARRAIARIGRGRHRDALPLPQTSLLDRLTAEARATSLPHMLAVHDAMSRLRAQLDPDDQILLVLRVDRELAWRDIAEVLAAEGEDVDKLSASLRKRFERVKARIRTLAEGAGLA